jgi:hypothetical protein
MEQFIGTKGVYVVDVDIPNGFVPKPQLNIKVNTFIKD